ncbi:MAG: tetratricopeptide repeat protein [Verrucomicrobiota bacterium]
MALVFACGLFLCGCRVLHLDGSGAPGRKAALSKPGVESAAVDAQAHYGTGVLRAVGGDVTGALGEFYAAAEKDPANVELAMEVSQLFIQAGQFDKAVAVLESAASQPKAPGELFSRLGTLYFQLNRLEPAVTAGRTALKKNPQSTEALAVLFQICWQGRKFAEASKLIDDAARSAAASPEVLVFCGESYLRLGMQMPESKNGMQARALDAFQRAKGMAEATPEVLLRLADGFTTLRRTNETAAVFQSLLDNFPELSTLRETVRTKLSQLYLGLNDHAHAAILYKEMLRDNPTDARNYFILGTLAIEATNAVEAAEYLSKAILLNPDFQPAYASLANVQLNLNQPREALETLAAARKKFPPSFPIEYLGAMAAVHQRDFTNAVRCFTSAEVIARSGDAGQLREVFYFQFGSACERVGDLAQAEKHFLNCLTLNPDFDEAQNYLGYMWAERGQNLDRARELIAKAVKKEPENAAYLDSMAWVLFQLKQPQLALDYALKAAAHADEEDAEIFTHLGDIYAELGQPEKAREAWSKSLKLAPSPEVEKKLEALPR